MVRQTLIAGNWKMNGSRAEAQALAGAIAGQSSANGPEVLVCPPFPFLSLVAEQLAGSAVALGAQNVSQHDSGAYTGETSAGMLADLNCQYVIVGHSERRQYYAEDSALVATKARVVAAAGMRPIVCVGETLDEREAAQTENVLSAQLAAVFEHAATAYPELVIAYEPVWAIGTGKTATPEQAQEVHSFIRGALSQWDSGMGSQTRILYGGSVKPDNAAALMAMADVDGGLVGGASLSAESFVGIINAV